MKATKKELERALEMACSDSPICNNCALYSLPCRSKWHRDSRESFKHCYKKRKSHFLALAKQGKKEGK